MAASKPMCWNPFQRETCKNIKDSSSIKDNIHNKKHGKYMCSACANHVKRQADKGVPIPELIQDGQEKSRASPNTGKKPTSTPPKSKVPSKASSNGKLKAIQAKKTSNKVTFKEPLAKKQSKGKLPRASTPQEETEVANNNDQNSEGIWSPDPEYPTRFASQSPFLMGVGQAMKRLDLCRRATRSAATVFLLEMQHDDKTRVQTVRPPPPELEAIYRYVLGSKYRTHWMEVSTDLELHDDCKDYHFMIALVTGAVFRAGTISPMPWTSHTEVFGKEHRQVHWEMTNLGIRPELLAQHICLNRIDESSFEDRMIDHAHELIENVMFSLCQHLKMHLDNSRIKHGPPKHLGWRYNLRSSLQDALVALLEVRVRADAYGAPVDIHYYVYGDKWDGTRMEHHVTKVKNILDGLVALTMFPCVTRPSLDPKEPPLILIKARVLMVRDSSLLEED